MALPHLTNRGKTRRNRNMKKIDDNIKKAIEARDKKKQIEAMVKNIITSSYKEADYSSKGDEDKAEEQRYRIKHSAIEIAKLSGIKLEQEYLLD